MHNRHSIEAAQRCRELGEYVADDAADALNLPLDLTTETRKIIDDLIMPAALMREPGDFEKWQGQILDAYEAKLTRRRMAAEPKDGESYFERFRAEQTLITALGYVAQEWLKKHRAWLMLDTESEDYQPEAALFYRTDDEDGRNAVFFRTVSRWDNDTRARLDYPAILTTLRARGPAPQYIHIQPIVVGSVDKDNGYAMPLTRRYVDGATGQYWWAPQKMDPAGNVKRLGRSWRKEILEPAQTEEWIDMLLSDRAGFDGALDAVFPEPVVFRLDGPVVTAARNFHSSLKDYPAVKESRACFFPNDCPFLTQCWGA